MRPANRLSILSVLVMITSLSACSSSSSSPKASDPEFCSTIARPPSQSAVSPQEGTIPWPAPSDPMARACAAGLTPETAERLEFHVHAQLDVFIDGKPIVVPGGIGIDTNDPDVHRGVVDGFPAY